MTQETQQNKKYSVVASQCPLFSCKVCSSCQYFALVRSCSVACPFLTCTMCGLQFVYNQKAGD